jgi:peroxiredoxin/tetratricopeptide (TPR) repeat protein
MAQDLGRKQIPDPRCREILAAYEAARAAGQPVTPATVLDSHPDLADQLRPLLNGPDTNPAITQEFPGAGPGTAPMGPGAPTLGPADAPPGVAVPVFREFGDYELLQEVARGGMGVIFKAHQKSLNRIVALKMILSAHLASPEQVRRFHTEAEEAGNLDHPNIVPIYQVGQEGGQHYYTMKFIEGGSLAEQISRLRRDPRAAARLVATAARAVHYAHQRGLLHRDLKPANILLDAEGQPHITDFGLVKHMGGPATTQSGAIVGTPAYMAPEQAAARRDLSVAVDVYALGAILYELMTGRPPFQADSPLDTLLLVMEQEPARPRSLDPHVNLDLETICLKCLEKDPQRRYASAARLADDLERYLAGEPILARPVSRVERTVKWVRRRPAAAAMLAVCGLAALVLALGGWWSSAHLAVARRRADDARQTAERNWQVADEQRRLAEERQQEADQQRQAADQQRQAAQVSAAEAQRQAGLVKANVQKRLDVIDDFLVRMDGRLQRAQAPGPLRLEFLNDALQLSTGVLKEDPKNPSARRQAGRVYFLVAELMRQNNSLPQAEPYFKRALDLQRKLTKDVPDKPDYRNDLAITCARYAKLLQATRRYGDGLKVLDESIRLEDELAAQQPRMPDYRMRASYYRFRRADLLEEQGQRPQAEQGYREALRQQEELVAGSRNPEYESDLAETAASLSALLAEGNPAAGVPSLERSLQARRQARNLAPVSQLYAQRLRDGYSDLNVLYQKAGDAAAMSRLADALRRDFPDSNNDTYNAACYAALAAGVARKAPKVPEAERQRLADGYAKQAISLLDKSFYEGFRERAHVDDDLDLVALRDRPDYKELLADLDKRYPGLLPAPAQEVTGLQQEYNARQTNYLTTLQAAETIAQRKRAEARRPQMQEFADRALRFADRHRDAPAAVEALAWLLETTAPAEGEEPDPSLGGVRRRALDMLERDHLKKAELADVCTRLSKNPTPDCDRLLRTAMTKHSQRDVKGAAGYALALSLEGQAERAFQASRPEASTLASDAERQLEQVAKDYATVPFGKSTLGEVAGAKLYALRHLSVGRSPDEISGEDLDGQGMKLSEYRGKVTVVFFWVDWCGYCRQFYGQAKEMTARLKGQPFAVVGVNCDDDKADARRAVDKDKLPWRSWWDGGRAGDRIAKRWQVDAFPGIYVLDHRGVIRYKDLRGPQLEAAVQQLLAEAAKDSKAARR